MNHPKNKCYTDSIENCILFNIGSLSADTFLCHCCQALNCEYESWLKEDFWRPFFTYHEVTLLNYIALIYESKQELNKSIFILEHLLTQLNQSEVKLEDRYKSSMTVIGNLSTMYGQIGNLDQCLFMCEKGIQICLDSARGMRLPNFLTNKAEALNDKAKHPTQKSKRYLEWAYYISDLMSTHSASSYIDQYYREHYDANVCWY